jgi:hypothetical protein
VGKTPAIWISTIAASLIACASPHTSSTPAASASGSVVDVAAVDEAEWARDASRHSLPPATLRGVGPAPKAPAAQVESPPLPTNPALVRSKWFRPGQYSAPVSAEDFALGLVLVGAEPELGHGVSRLDAEGNLLWQLPVQGKVCLLSAGGNTICQISAEHETTLEVAVYDELGRVVWQSNLEKFVADDQARRVAGFGSSKPDAFLLDRMRVVGEFLFVESEILRDGEYNVSAPEHSLLCLDLDGTLRWIAGTQARAIPAAEIAAWGVFRMPSELARDYARTSAPTQAWTQEWPSSDVISALPASKREHLRWLPARDGWFALIPDGSPGHIWDRVHLVLPSADGPSRVNVKIDAPSDTELALEIRSIVEGPRDRLYLHWSDGRIDALSGKQRLGLDTYAQSIAVHEHGQEQFLLVHRRLGTAPRGFEDRPAGAELFSL